MAAKSRSPFEPFATIVGVCATFWIAGLALGIVGALLGWGHLWGLGERTLCVQNDHYSIGNDGALPPSFRPGVDVSAAAMSLCVSHASLGQHVLNVLRQISFFALYTGALVLLWWLLNGAKRNGPFHAATAGRVRFLGWLLMLGGVLATSTERLANNLLLRTMMVPSDAPSWWANLPGLPPSLVLTGLGLIVVARILKVGVRMQDDLAGTV